MKGRMLMKELRLSFLENNITSLISDEITLQLNPNENFFDAILRVEKMVAEKTKGKFPVEGLKTVLQLIWDPNTGEFYSDVALEARDAENNWISLRRDPYLDLPSGSRIVIVPDAGC